MLRLFDAGRGATVEAVRGRTLRVGGDPSADPAAWAVTVDMLRRVADRQRVPVVLALPANAVPALNARPSRIDPGPVDVLLDVQASYDGAIAELSDPLALRLALLCGQYAAARPLGPEDLPAVEHRLQQWRDRVAEWAESPSKPICAEYLSRFTDALDDNLDTPAALSVLQELAEDVGIPPGSKLETFLHLDELLGLDLARDIGRRPRR